MEAGQRKTVDHLVPQNPAVRMVPTHHCGIDSQSARSRKDIWFAAPVHRLGGALRGHLQRARVHSLRVGEDLSGDQGRQSDGGEGGGLDRVVRGHGFAAQPVQLGKLQITRPPFERPGAGPAHRRSPKRSAALGPRAPVTRGPAPVEHTTPLVPRPDGSSESRSSAPETASRSNSVTRRAGKRMRLFPNSSATTPAARIASINHSARLLPKSKWSVCVFQYRRTDSIGNISTSRKTTCPNRRSRGNGTSLHPSPGSPEHGRKQQRRHNCGFQKRQAFGSGAEVIQAARLQMLQVVPAPDEAQSTQRERRQPVGQLAARRRRKR